MSLEPDLPGPPPKTLVLGSAGHPRAVTSYAWHEIPSDLNVTDYGLVILDATSLSDPDHARDLDAARLPACEQFARLMFSASTIVFIGESVADDRGAERALLAALSALVHARARP